ncbi:B-cell linker protein-like isoform X4 [Pocillopora verrucosa]|uniref:B-cell linker protein-like isoform X4 n=1 Tax=Pocillopora verrucosa TaxID=203993 RepID=UPI003340D40D
MSSLSEACIYDWDLERMLMWLREENLHDCVQPFSFKKINGIQFMNLSDNDIKSLRISQESKRKLAKVLKRIKGKRQSARKRFDGDSSGLKERRKPPALPANVLDEEAESDDGWATDDFDDDPDEFEEEESDDESGGEYIEAEENESLIPSPESPSKEVPKVPFGLVAQLKAGLNGTVGRAPCTVPSESHRTKTTPMPYDDDDDQIYDEPPEEVYEEPSDDSGSGIVVRPQCHKKIIRCDSSEGYIDARSTSVIPEEPVQCPPPAPARPPKPGFLKAKKPAPVIQPEPEIYDEVPEDDELGRTQVVEQETYEVPDDMDGSQQSSKPSQYEGDGETYEVPEQEDQETYEVPEESAPSQPPPRPSLGGFGLKPTKMGTPAEKTKPIVPKDLPKPKPGIKPSLASKPQVNQKPNVPGPVRGTPKRSSRLYPAPKDNTGSRPPMATPSQEPEKNNNEIPQAKPSSRLPAPNSRQPAPPPVEDTPPPPPRPGAKPTLKPSRVSDLDSQRKSQALPPLPDQKSADPLKQYPWFLGPLDKKVAENALNSFSKEGAFIVRNSSKDPNSYSMSLYFNRSVRHLRIPRLQNKKYVLGDSGKVQFDTIVELVDYYSQHHVDLRSGGSTSLTAACPVK